MGLKVQVASGMAEIDRGEWNALAGTAQPFLRYEFLAALERHGCVGDTFGWLPHHLTLRDDQQRLIGAVPLYLKDNSYGEFVFDWAWADAYERSGRPYYPKLVSAVPYTPATGPRILSHPAADPALIHDRLIAASLDYARELGVSSLHWLFPEAEQQRALEHHGLLARTGCQFHWDNRGYTSFDDFLGALTAQKRKKIRQERRRAHDHGLHIERVHGHEATPDQIRTAELFYRSTFDRKWGVATLNLGFFEDVARTMGEQLLLVLARDSAHYVAGAICFRSADTLYGRHWGCIEDYHSLHFELCYYQGIDYCIEQGLARFEPGAQGEHKLARGFLPQTTWSAHWIRDSQFRSAIADFLSRERAGIAHYIDSLGDHSPYRAQGS